MVQTKTTALPGLFEAAGPNISSSDLFLYFKWLQLKNAFPAVTCFTRRCKQCSHDTNRFGISWIEVLCLTLDYKSQKCIFCSISLTPPDLTLPTESWALHDSLWPLSQSNTTSSCPTYEPCLMHLGFWEGKFRIRCTDSHHSDVKWQTVGLMPITAEGESGKRERAAETKTSLGMSMCVFCTHALC